MTHHYRRRCSRWREILFCFLFFRSHNCRPKMVLEKNKMASDARWFSKKNNAITRLRDAYVGTRMLPRKTLSRGLFENPVYTLRGETTCPRVNIPASQHQREGPGRNFNRKGLPRASPKSDKSTFLVRTFIPGAMTICYFWTTPWDAHLCAFSAQKAAPCHGPYHTEHAARVHLQIAAVWAEQSPAMITSCLFF